jgi:hypothetical protein
MSDKTIKKQKKLDVVSHTYSLSTREAEAEGSQVQGQPGS